MQYTLKAVATEIEAWGKMHRCHIWDIGKEAHSPPCNKWQPYLSHITQNVAFALFYSVGSDKKLRNAFGKIKCYTYINILLLLLLLLLRSLLFKLSVIPINILLLLLLLLRSLLFKIKCYTYINILLLLLLLLRSLLFELSVIPI